MEILHIEKPCGKIADDIICIWKEAFGDSEEFIRNFMDASFYRGCVAAVKYGRVISAVHLTCPTDDEGLIYGYAVATLSSERGKGICRMLHESIFASCREKYATYAVHPANTSLVAFYTGLGMKTVTYRYFSDVEGDGGKYVKISPKEYCEMRSMLCGDINEDWLKIGEYDLLGFDIDGIWCAACMSDGRIWEVVAPPQLEGAAARRAATHYGKARLCHASDVPVASECALMTYNRADADLAIYME